MGEELEKQKTTITVDSPQDNFDIIVRRRNNRIQVSIPDLWLYAHADDLPTAMRLLDEKKELLLADLSAAGVLDQLGKKQSRLPATEAASLRQELVRFLAKFAIVGFILSAAFAAVASIAITQVASVKSNVTKQLKNLTGAQIASVADRLLERAAAPTADLSEEKRRKILSEIKILAERWGPFIDEAAAALKLDGHGNSKLQPRQ